MNFLTSTQPSSGLAQATTANTVLCSMRKCEDPEGPNQAYEKPPIIEDMEIAEIDEDKLGLDRLETLTEKLYADMGPGEKSTTSAAQSATRRGRSRTSPSNSGKASHRRCSHALALKAKKRTSSWSS